MMFISVMGCHYRLEGQDNFFVKLANIETMSNCVCNFQCYLKFSIAEA